MTVTYLNPQGMRASPSFSHVAIAEPGRLAFIAGQTAMASDGSVIGPDDVAAQTHAVFAALETILISVGSGFPHVCEFTTYVVGAENRVRFQEARAEVFRRIYPDSRCPPNTLVIISGLAKPEILLEISAVARVP
jgi:enamine deaminase RidA (YjgF/YER057c/UK114 family)